MNRIDRERQQRKTTFERGLRISIGRLEVKAARDPRWSAELHHTEQRLIMYLEYLTDPELDGL